MLPFSLTMSSMAAAGGAVEPPADATATFGALTFAGAGGVPIPAGSTSITDADGTNLVIDGNDRLVPDTGGGVTAGTVVFDDGSTMEVATVVNGYSVRDWTEALVVLGLTRSDPTEILVRGPGEDGEILENGSQNFYGLFDDLTGAVTLRAHDQDDRFVMRKWQFSSPSPAWPAWTVQDFKAVIEPNLDITTPFSLQQGIAVIDCNHNITDLTVRRFEIDGGMGSFVSGQLEGRYDKGVELHSSNVNTIIEDFDIHSIHFGVVAKGNAIIRNGSVRNVWGDFYEIAEGCDDILFDRVHGNGIAGNSESLHTDALQFITPSTSGMENVRVRASTFSPFPMTGSGEPVPNLAIRYANSTGTGQIPTFTAGTHDIDAATYSFMEIRADATAGNVILNITDAADDPALVDYTVGFRRVGSSSNTVTVTLQSGDTHEDAPDVLSLNVGQQVLFRFDGTTTFKRKRQGVYGFYAYRNADWTHSQTFDGVNVLADVSAGDVVLTLTDGALRDQQVNIILMGPTNGNKLIVRKPTANAWSVPSPLVAPSGDDFEIADAGAAFSINALSVATWSVVEGMVAGFQGIFGNGDNKTIGGFTFDGNIIVSNAGSGIHIEDDDIYAQAVVNNTLLPTIPMSVGADGVLSEIDGYAAGDLTGRIYSRGPDSYATGNLTHGSVFLTELDVRNTALGVSLPSPHAQIPEIEAIFDVDTAAGFEPQTRAEIIAAATPKAGTDAALNRIGAVGYIDFDTGEILAGYPGPTILSAVPADGATVIVETTAEVVITLDQPITAVNTGSITVYDVTGDASLGTFDVTGADVTVGTGAEANQITVDISSIVPMPNDSEISVTIPAGAFTGAVTDNAELTMSFTTRRAAADITVADLEPLYAANTGYIYEPADLTTLFTDTGGTTAVSADGDAVARLESTVGTNHMTAGAGAGTEPLYKTSAGLHWLQFDGSNDVIYGVNLDFSDADAETPLYAVIALRFNGSGSAAVGASMVIQEHPNAFWLTYDGDTKIATGAPYDAVAAGTLTDDTVTVLEMERRYDQPTDTATWTVWIDGVQVTTGTRVGGGYAAILDTAAASLGGRVFQSGNVSLAAYATVDVFAAASIRRATTEGERYLFRSWAANAGGVTL